MGAMMGKNGARYMEEMNEDREAGDVYGGTTMI